MSDKICENCKKKIDEKRDRYFKVVEYLEGKDIETKYVHKQCQDNFNNNLNSNLELQENAKKFLNKANNMLKGMGAEEVVRI